MNYDTIKNLKIKDFFKKNLDYKNTYISEIEDKI
jgi:hypothetical protein